MFTPPTSRRTRGGIQKLAAIAAEREAAEAQADQPLRPDIAGALEAAHEQSISARKAQAEYHHALADAAYEQAAAAAEPVQYYVKRGGEWGRVQNSKPKPGETVYVRRENEMEAVGVVDSRGEPPPPEIQL
jgi:hypothetical protein